MTACDRFDSEGLARFVAGEPLDAHGESCPECRNRLASYQALATALGQAREMYSPPGNWEAQVWARIQRGKATSQRRWAPFVGLAAAAAAAAVLFLTSSFGGPESLVLSTDFEGTSGATVRGGPSHGGNVQSAPPGAVWHVLAKVPRGKVGDLRVYRGEELVFQCAAATCIHSKDTLEARVTLDRAGTYRAVAIAADVEVPAATGNLDADYAAAIRAGKATESAPVEVL